MSNKDSEGPEPDAWQHFDKDGERAFTEEEKPHDYWPYEVEKKPLFAPSSIQQAFNWKEDIIIAKIADDLDVDLGEAGKAEAIMRSELMEVFSSE